MCKTGEGSAREEFIHENSLIEEVLYGSDPELFVRFPDAASDITSGFLNMVQSGAPLIVIGAIFVVIIALLAAGRGSMVHVGATLVFGLILYVLLMNLPGILMWFDLM